MARKQMTYTTTVPDAPRVTSRQNDVIAYMANRRGGARLHHLQGLIVQGAA